MPRLVHRAPVPEKIATSILRLIRRGNSIGTAAEQSGIHRTTFYDWLERGTRGDAGYVAFAKRVMIAKAEAEIVMFDLVRTAMEPQGFKTTVIDEDGNRREVTTFPPRDVRTPGAQLAKWWLSVRNRPDWAEHHVVTGPDGGPVKIDVTKLSDEELRKVLDGTFIPPTPLPVTDAQVAPPREPAEAGARPKRARKAKRRKRPAGGVGGDQRNPPVGSEPPQDQ